jgi:hypothetical protein
VTQAQTIAGTRREDGPVESLAELGVSNTGSLIIIGKTDIQASHIDYYLACHDSQLGNPKDAKPHSPEAFKD